jgi:hypothetical protein
MSRKLNAVRDESAARELESAAKGLAARLAMPMEGWAPKGLNGHCFITAGIYLRIAQNKYQLEYPNAEIVDALHNAARWKADELSVVHQHALQRPLIWPTVLGWIGLVTAFGSDKDCFSVSTLPPSLVVGFESPDAPGCEIARAWLRKLAGDPLDRVALVVQAERCRAENAERWDAQLAGPTAQCLIAIADGNAAEMSAGLEGIAQFTQREAQRGEWRLLGEGQMSLIGLGLCAQARRAGLRASIQSPYIPTELLDHVV